MVALYLDITIDDRSTTPSGPTLFVALHHGCNFQVEFTAVSPMQQNKAGDSAENSDRTRKINRSTIGTTRLLRLVRAVLNEKPIGSCIDCLLGAIAKEA